MDTSTKSMETTTIQAMEGSRQASRRCCCCSGCTWCILCVLVTVAILAGAVLAWYFMFYRQEESDPISFCGDCHCVLSVEVPICPEPPVMEYSAETIAFLASQVALNPYTLSCDPYADANVTGVVCDTVPPLDEFPPGNNTNQDDGPVCGLHYDSYQDGVCSIEYRLQSYANLEESQAAGAFVTHYGACGVCSTTQDLAAYLRSPDLTTEGKYCSKQLIYSVDYAVQCYRDLGFTKDCATIWAYNGQNTFDKCVGICATHRGGENNGPPPECKLNECLQCDEDESGPIFKKFAARTRRRSGLLSAIVRPCDVLVDITHEACPETLALVE